MDVIYLTGTHDRGLTNQLCRVCVILLFGAWTVILLDIVKMYQQKEKIQVLIMLWEIKLH